MSQPQIMQYSFVVEDLDSAIGHWSGRLHVGPFFVIDHVPYDECRYLGEDSDIDMAVAIAYHGDVQVELVKQHNDAASIFREHLETKGPGLQHVASISSDLGKDLAAFAERGLTPVQEGLASNGTRFAYLDCTSNPVPGTMLELVELPAEVLTAFDYMKKTAASWDPLKDEPRR